MRWTKKPGPRGADTGKYRSPRHRRATLSKRQGPFARDFPMESMEVFLWSWRLVSDRLLATGFINPDGFVEAVDRLGVAERFMPDPMRAVVFAAIYVSGCHREEATVGHILLACEHWGAPASEDDIREVVFSFGTDSGMEDFVRETWDAGMRAILYRQWPRFFTDARPIDEIASALLQEVSRVG